MFNSGFDNVHHGLDDVRSMFYTVKSINPRERAIEIIDRRVIEYSAACKAALAYREAADTVHIVYGKLYREARERLDASIDHTSEFWSAAASHQESYNLLRAASLTVLTAEREYDIAHSRYLMICKLLEEFIGDDEDGDAVA